MKQVGSPTKARAGFLKIGLPLNWEAAVGFTKWGIVIFSDMVAKAGWQGWIDKSRSTRSDWQGRVGKLGLTRREVIKKEELEK